MDQMLLVTIPAFVERYEWERMFAHEAEYIISVVVIKASFQGKIRFLLTDLSQMATLKKRLGQIIAFSDAYVART